MGQSEMSAEQGYQRTADIELIRSIIGAHLRVNPWDAHWREPIFQAACAIVDRLAARED